jgi:hypothetical protein
MSGHHSKPYEASYYLRAACLELTSLCNLRCTCCTVSQPHYVATTLRDNAWALGVAFGYRWYFSKTAGLCVQATYHHVSGWSLSPIWAAQGGISFRF